jgi:hypothetical protein
MGVLPILLIVRVLRARGTPGRSLPYPSERARCASKEDPSALIPSLFAKHWKRIVKPGAYRGLFFTRGPGGFEDGWPPPYSTSTIMVWLAFTRSWSFVAPVTVILWSPLLRPFSVPENPF